MDAALTGWHRRHVVRVFSALRRLAVYVVYGAFVVKLLRWPTCLRFSLGLAFGLFVFRFLLLDFD